MPTTSAVPAPITAGAEMELLRSFMPDVRWTGHIEAGGMGPGTPAMTAVGRGDHALIQNGRWIVGTYSQEQYLQDGTHVLTWQLHWVAGWSPASGDYRATFADCYGNAGVMRGHVQDSCLVFESTGDPAFHLRLTWDRTDPAAPRWRNEASVDGTSWTLVEEYVCRPVAGS